MPFQIGLNLPGSAFDAYLNPPNVGTALGGLGKGIGSALDEAFGKGDYWKSANNKCASGSCSHKEHTGAGGGFAWDEFGNISQGDGGKPAEDATATPDATLFRDHNKPSGPWDGVKRNPGEFLDDNGEDNDPSHYDAQGYAPYGRATDPNSALLAEYDKSHPSSSLDAALANPAQSPVDSGNPFTSELAALKASMKGGYSDDPKISKAAAAAAKATAGKYIEVLAKSEKWKADQLKAAQDASEHAIDNARADKQLRVSESHLEIAMRGENRQQADDDAKAEKDAKELHDWNQQAAKEGLLPPDTEPGYEQPPIFARDTKARIGGKPVVPFTSAEVAESAVKQKWAERTKEKGYEHSDAAREDRQVFTAAQNEQKQKHAALLLSKKQEFSALYKKQGNSALAGAKAALSQTTQLINDRFNDALLKFKTKDLETDAEYNEWVTHRQALKEFITENSGGDPLAALKPPGANGASESSVTTRTGPAPKPKGGDYPDATWDDETKVRFDNLPEVEKAKLRKSLTPSR